MRTWKRTRERLAIPFRLPALLALSVAYAGILYGAGSQAGFLEVRSHYWVLSVGALLLLSPIYHALLLPGVAGALRGRRADWRAAVRALPDLFVRLFIGEVVVGAVVIAGGLLLLIPGIYLGMRLIYYKQAIVFEDRSVAGALRESVRRTSAGRPTLGLFAVLTVLYGGAVGLDSLLVAFAPDPVVHAGGIVGSAVLLAWMNVMVTSTYDGRADGE